VIPQFDTEAEESEWWYQNREALAEEFELAKGKGRLHFGSNALRLAKGEVVAELGNSQRFMNFLAERSREKGVISIEQLAKELDSGDA
jgi:hypothetical protein